MQSAQSITDVRNRPAGRSGFSLVEMMVVVVVIGILSAMAAPSFNKAVEQSRANIAYANLRAIWAAERVYWLENHAYTGLSSLQTLKLVDIPSDSTSVGGYTYAASQNGDDFTATATRDSGSGWSGSFQTNSSGTITGSISGGGTTITPGAIQ
jgi:prepilin-type N-terminal cleavage/methylation domain-containing protein